MLKQADAVLASARAELKKSNDNIENQTALIDAQANKIRSISTNKRVLKVNKM